MSTESLQGQAGHQTEIHVNNKLVLVVGPRLSGLAIKEAAIGQNVAIQLDFLLSEDGQHGKPGQNIGDGDLVTVTKNSRFTAVAPDDNS
jgi:hypothetical protein